MRVSEIMVVDPLTVTERTSVREALRLMDDNVIRHLPVVRGGTLIGVLSDRDLLGDVGWLVSSGSDEVELAPRTVGDVMQPVPLSVRPEDSVADAARQMAEWGVGCLLVTRHRELVGLVSEIDVLSAFAASALEGREDPAVGEPMTADVVTVAPDCTLSDAQRTMAEGDFRHLPVVQDGRLAGILSDRDLRRAAGRGEPEELPVSRVMTRRVRTVPLGTRLSEAARRMVEEKIGALPVEGEDGRLAGILTVTDVLAHCTRALDD